MDKVFTVELSGGNGRYCELDVPATDYELLDALDLLQMTPSDRPDWEIIGHTEFRYLHAFLSNECSLYELNSLARKLGTMDQHDRTAFEGLFKMALDRRDGPMSARDLFTYANSTDCCHVIDAVNDQELGRFYAENEFLPELENLPDSIFEKLDFARIGKEMRSADRGVYTRQGYVLQNADMKPFTGSMDVPPQDPKYIFRLLIGRYPFETNGQPEKQIALELPAAGGQMLKALEECGAASWEETVVQMEESAIPRLWEDDERRDTHLLNELAQVIQYRKDRNELPKLKAVLLAANCCDANTALVIAEELDDYFHEPGQRTPEEVAMAELKFAVSQDTLSTLQKHVDLYNYGWELISSCNAMMTPYGLAGRSDGEMIFAPEPPSHWETMKME